MKKILLILIAFALASTQLFAQERTFTSSINHYININGTSEQYSDAIDQLFVMLKQQYVSQNVAATTWTELEGEKQNSLNQIKVMLASAYRSHFDHEDINNLIDFYESPAGRQYKVDPVQLSEEQKDQITLFYQSETGKKLKQQSVSLNEMVGQISQSWSTQLYLSMKEKLAAKGHQI